MLSLIKMNTAHLLVHFFNEGHMSGEFETSELDSDVGLKLNWMYGKHWKRCASKRVAYTL